ncbi:MAG: RNA-guided endonuclease InsQ/TnpB family protein [Isosphaeraceae bacterium]
MKLTLQTQLLPDAEAATKLKSTVERFNQAATWLTGVAFARKLANKFALQKLCYAELRERFGLPADTAIRCIAQVVVTYKRDKDKRPKFRKHASVPFSMGKNIGFKGPDRVSISTLDGRVVVPYVMGKYQAERFGFAKGQCDLVLRKDGKWFLLVTVDIPDEAKMPTKDFLGVDLGAINIAVDEDGDKHSSEPIEQVRRRNAGRRKTLDQAAAARKRRGKRPQNIRRAKCRQEQKEARFRKDVNHRISKKLVAKAKDTGRGIALEDLEGIRDRTQFRKPQRARISGWAFFQLRSFVEYKAALAGVPIELVDARNTSRTCPECGHCEKANRKSQSEFKCRHCGYSANADFVGARNIGSRARVAVNQPMVAKRHRDQPRG